MEDVTNIMLEDDFDVREDDRQNISLPKLLSILSPIQEEDENEDEDEDEMEN